jgi:hypothetical protein
MTDDDDLMIDDDDLMTDADLLEVRDAVERARIALSHWRDSRSPQYRELFAFQIGFAYGRLGRISARIYRETPK